MGTRISLFFRFCFSGVRLHLAQSVEGAVVEVAAIDERPQRAQEAFAGGGIAGNRPRLLPRVAFPVAALALEVLLHRRERPRHPPGVAERAQAQVDAMAEAVGRRFVEQLCQLLPEPRVVLLGCQRARAVAFAVVLVAVYEVDVGGEVELAATQLAQREHDQPLRVAVGIADDAVAFGEVRFQCRQPGLQAAFGQRRGAGQRRVDRVQAEHVAPYQPGRFGSAMAAQQRLPVGSVAGVQRWQHEWLRLPFAQGGQQGRLPCQGGDGEVAGDRDARHLRPHGVVIELRRQQRRGGAQALQRAFGDGGQFGVGSIHRVDSCIWAARAGRSRWSVPQDPARPGVAAGRGGCFAPRLHPVLKSKRVFAVSAVSRFGRSRRPPGWGCSALLTTSCL